MQAILKLIQAIFFAIDYARKNPRKAGAGVLVGATGLGYGGYETYQSFYGAPGVPTNPPGLTVGGTPSDGDVPTWVDPTGPEWAAGGGGGGGISYDGTVTDGQIPVYDDTANEYIPTQAGAPVFSVKNPISYTRLLGGDARMVRAAGSNLSTTGTIDVGVDANEMTVAAATSFERGHGVAILGAGADHNLSTKSAPLVFHQTQVQDVVLPNSNTWASRVTFTASTSTNLITTSQPLTITNGGVSVILATEGTMPTYATTTAFTENTAGLYFPRTVTTTTFSLHPTALDATNNTNAIDIDGAGTGTHTLAVVGSTTYSYSIRAMSGNGGSTAESTAATITTGAASLNGQIQNLLVWPKVTGENGYVIYDEVNNYALTAVAGDQTCVVMTADAAGYTNLEIGDIGRTLVQGSHDGIIMGFDNATRQIVIEPTIVGTDTFPGGAAVSWTITSGTGGGTQTSASVASCFWRDHGETISATAYKRWCRRNSAECYVGELVLYPSSSSGVFYRVYKVFGDRTLASSAPSYNTALGAFTTDGNVILRRENTTIPPSPTGAEILDTHWTTITDVSGTTITLADAATTSITSQIVFHDDTDAFQAWQTRAVTAGTASTTLEVPKGDYQLCTGILSGTGQDARWGTGLGGGTNDYALFNMYGRQEVHFDPGATLIFSPMDTFGTVANSLGTLPGASVFRTLGAEPTFRNVNAVCASIGEPVFEKAERATSSGYNNLVFLSTFAAVSANQTGGPRFYQCNVLGFPRSFHSAGGRGFGQGDICRDCTFTYGGADGDNTFYTKGGEFQNVTVIGIRWTRSYTYYQDSLANPSTIPLVIKGGYHKNIRKESARFRANGGYIGENSYWEDCSRIYCSENPVGLTIENSKFVRTDIEPAGCDDVKLLGLTLSDGRITIASGSDGVLIDNLQSATPSGGTTFSTGTSHSLLSISGGTDIKVVNSDLAAKHGTGAPNVSGLLISGGSDEIALTNNTFRGNQDWGVRVATFTGTLRTTNNLFGGVTGPESVQSQLGSAAVWISTNDIFEATTTSNEIAFNGGGRTELINPTFTGKLSVETGVTGPFIIRGGRSTSSTAAAISEPSVIIQDHNFAVAPTLTGATLNLSNNKVADSESVTVAAAIAATANNYVLPVTDVVIVTLTGNQSMTGIAARANGVETILVNGDGADTLTLEHQDGGSDAGNRITGTGAADVVLGPGAACKLRWANGTVYATAM
jgi:hypothetical protein